MNNDFCMVLEKLFNNKFELLELFEKHNITSYWFNLTNSNLVAFNYQAENNNIKLEVKREINTYLSSLGFFTRKNIAELKTGDFQNNIDIAYEIVKEYKNYFEPIWKENNEGKYHGVVGKNIELQYRKIEKKDNGLIYVDDYSSDMYFKIINTALEDLFKHGNEDEINRLFTIIRKYY